MIYYKLDTKLNGKALDKMQETIPPLIQLITDIVDSNETVEDIITELRDQLPYSITSWTDKTWIINEYEVQIHLARSGLFPTHIILDFKDVIRDLKIKELLK